MQYVNINTRETVTVFNAQDVDSINAHLQKLDINSVFSTSTNENYYVVFTDDAMTMIDSEKFKQDYCEKNRFEELDDCCNELQHIEIKTCSSCGRAYTTVVCEFCKYGIKLG